MSHECEIIQSSERKCAHFEMASPFSYGLFAACCAALGERLHLKNDCGCQSRLTSQSVVSKSDGFALTPGPSLNALGDPMSAEWPVNDDSIREFKTCVSLCFCSISFSLEGKITPSVFVCP